MKVVDVNVQVRSTSKALVTALVWAGEGSTSGVGVMDGVHVSHQV